MKLVSIYVWKGNADMLERSQLHLNRLDLVVRAAEIKWGIMDRLETLCSPETATKFGNHWAKLSMAIMASEYEDVVLLADGAVRGVWRMEAEAIAAGHTPGALMPLGVGGSAPISFEPPVAAPKGFNGTVPDAAWFKAGGDPVPF